MALKKSNLSCVRFFIFLVTSKRAIKISFDLQILNSKSNQPKDSSFLKFNF